VITTYSLRLKDKHSAELSRQARIVNLVWNFCNATQRKAAKERRRWLTYIDLANLTSGTSKDLGISSKSIQQVARQYVKSRERHNKAWLRFRSHRKSLGWIPFPNQAVQIRGTKVRFNGRDYEPMHWRQIPEGSRIASGSFTCDARGRWYVNLCFEHTSEAKHNHPGTVVGIDIGLNTLATLSNGTKFDVKRHYRQSALRLGVAQRARKRRQATNIHAKIKNQRKDYLHKVSLEITRKYEKIYVGDVSSTAIIKKLRFAKSTYDASWSQLRTMLSYKSLREGGSTQVVDESYSTQICSSCRALPPERPRGLADLGIRGWVCSNCGTIHDRDVNAALNILRFGLESPVEGSICEME
jgi:putative transposase